MGERRQINFIADAEVWEKAKARAREQGMRLAPFVEALLARALDAKAEPFRSDLVPSGDWSQLLAAWYGARRSYVDTPTAMRLVQEAQLDLGWPAEALTWDQTWAMVQRLTSDPGGVAPDKISPEQRSAIERMWSEYLANSRSSRLEPGPGADIA